LSSQRPGEESEAEDQGKRVIHGAQLVSVETSRGPSKSLRIDHGGLLNEDPGLGPVE
jgi:hypothetical protein